MAGNGEEPPYGYSGPKATREEVSIVLHGFVSEAVVRKPEDPYIWIKVDRVGPIQVPIECVTFVKNNGGNDGRR